MRARVGVGVSVRVSERERTIQRQRMTSRELRIHVPVLGSTVGSSSSKIPLLLDMLLKNGH